MGRSISTRNMSGKEVSNMILDIQANHLEATMKKKAYLREKEAYNNSEKGKLESKVREITQKATIARSNAEKILQDAAKKLRAEIIELLKSIFYTQDGNKIKFSDKEFFERINYFDVPFTNLKSLCETYKASGVKYSEYESLFYDLIKNIDIRFAILAPKNSLLKPEIRFSFMTEENKDEMFKHIQDLELDKNRAFMKAYGKHFKNQLEIGMGV